MADEQQQRSAPTRPRSGNTPPTRPASPGTPAAPLDNFAGSTALNSAIENLPVSRPDAVARARDLIADPSYPPTDVVRQVSNLLARNLTAPAE